MEHVIGYAVVIVQDAREQNALESRYAPTTCPRALQYFTFLFMTPSAPVFDANEAGLMSIWDLGGFNRTGTDFSSLSVTSLNDSTKDTITKVIQFPGRFIILAFVASQDLFLPYVFDRIYASCTPYGVAHRELLMPAFCFVPQSIPGPDQLASVQGSCCRGFY